MSQHTDSPAGENRSSSANSPVYRDGDVSVFMNTRNIKTGPKAGTSYEVFTYVKGTQETGGAWRCDVPAQIEGYMLQNTNGGSDVVQLVEGQQVLARVMGQNAPYAILLAGVGLVENTVGDRTYRRLEVVSALAYTAENNPNRVQSFMIRSREANGDESSTRNLKCYTAIPAEGTGEKFGSKTVWVRLGIADAIAARDAVAKGLPYAEVRDDGIKLELVGIEQVENAKTPQSLLKFKATPVQQEQEQAPARSAGRGR